MPNLQFSEEQEMVLNFFRQAIDSILTGQQRQNLIKTLIVQGKAGSGKSAVIKAAKVMLNQQFGPNSYCVLAHTGAASNLIGGQTIHSKLKINIDFNLKTLSNRELSSLQEDLKDCYFLIF